MNIKDMTIAALGAAGLALATPAFAAYQGTVTINDAPGLGTGPGGAFRVDIGAVTPGSDLEKVKAYSPSQLAFCVEKNEFITLPGTYSANVSHNALAGGLGNSSTPGTVISTATPDPISKATAWLYSRFALGSLTSVAGFHYDDAGGNALQDAIWYLENEQDSPGTGAYLVAAALGTVGADWQQDALGAYDVVVLNLYDSNGNRSQDQLAIIPEPSSYYYAAAVLMIPVLVQVRRGLRSTRLPKD